MTVPARAEGCEIVASVSGGKDSTAMLLHLMELGVEPTPVFFDTGWEHADTLAYLETLERRLGVRIHRLAAERTMVELVRHKAMFPSRVRRFCTRALKVRPMAAFVASRSSEVVNTVGIRAAESASRAMMPEWEYSDALDCDVWRPIIGWTLDDVVNIHRRHGLEPNPLYLRGASRVGCWPCIFARKAEIRLVADTDPGRIDQIRELEDEITAAADARAAARGEANQHPRTWFAGRGPAAKGGRAGAMRIDRVVEWSRSGGAQLELFAPAGRPGCVRWGLCDTGTAEDWEAP